MNIIKLKIMYFIISLEVIKFMMLFPITNREFL